MSRYACPHCNAQTSFEHVTNVIERDYLFQYIGECGACRELVWFAQPNGRRGKVLAPPPRGVVADDLPDVVRESFEPAVESLRSHIWRGAVIMARSAVQAAVRERGAEGPTLAAEIQILATQGVLPAAMAEWAAEVKGAGNPVAHPKPDEAVTEEDAIEIVSFAEALFNYLYVVPAEVARRRARKKPKA